MYQQSAHHLIKGKPTVANPVRLEKYFQKINFFKSASPKALEKVFHYRKCFLLIKGDSYEFRKKRQKFLGNGRIS